MIHIDADLLIYTKDTDSFHHPAAWLGQECDPVLSSKRLFVQHTYYLSVDRWSLPLTI